MQSKEIFEFEEFIQEFCSSSMENLSYFLDIFYFILNDNEKGKKFFFFFKIDSSHFSWESF